MLTEDQMLDSGKMLNNEDLDRAAASAQGDADGVAASDVDRAAAPDRGASNFIDTHHKL